MPADALTGFATGLRQDRPQDIGTPIDILSVVQETFGAIVLDPCGSSVHPHYAETTYMLPEKDGLKEPWAAGTFANPPYEELQKWLKKSADEYQAGVREQILLVPARPRARWWCDYMHDIPTAIAWLKRIKFRGYTSSYPEALVLVYAGTFVAGFKAQVTSAGIANLISGRLREH